MPFVPNNQQHLTKLCGHTEELNRNIVLGGVYIPTEAEPTASYSMGIATIYDPSRVATFEVRPKIEAENSGAKIWEAMLGKVVQ